MSLRTSLEDASKSELLEILGQLGQVGFSENDEWATLYDAVRAAGLDDETIKAEVLEQRGR